MSGGFQERITHHAADQELIDFGQEVFDHVDLAEIFAPPITATSGLLGEPSRVSRISNSRSTRKPIAQLVGTEPLGNRDHRRLVAVAGAEGVVNIIVGQTGHFGGEGRIALLFAGMEPDVFQEDDPARSERLAQPLRRRADHVVRFLDRLADQLGKTSGDDVHLESAVLGGVADGRPR